MLSICVNNQSRFCTISIFNTRLKRLRFHFPPLSTMSEVQMNHRQKQENKATKFFVTCNYDRAVAEGVNFNEDSNPLIRDLNLL